MLPDPCCDQRERDNNAGRTIIAKRNMAGSNDFNLTSKASETLAPDFVP